MATSKQEQLYNEILEYYSYADRLIKAAEDANHKLSSQQFSIMEEVTNRLEDSVERLTTQYIEFVKTGESTKTTELIRDALNNISARVEECRSRILMLYSDDQK